MENCHLLPKNERGEWGPGLDTEELGLDPITHDTGKSITLVHLLYSV